MAVYERESVVQAPLSAVWDFHTTIDGLVRVTPGWMHLRVESITGPDGEPDPADLVAGTTVRLSVRPFGIGPRQPWTSLIEAREDGHEVAWFRDVMVEGPFPTWRHTHRFEALDGRTRMIDRVEYELPLGPLRPLSGVGRGFLDPFFRFRHRRVRSLLE